MNTLLETYDYHDKPESWDVGMNVTHVTDDGQTCKGRIIDVDPVSKTLHIQFTDGEEGWEKPETCFTT